MAGFSKNLTVIIKSIITILVIYVAYARLPEVLREPRFWAEEGTNYFSFAYSHNWLENLFSPQYGYNTLYNSIATSLATIPPLEYAPAVTTYLALALQLAVSAAAIWWEIPLLDTLPKKAAAAVLIQTLAYPRIWATTIGVQYWLCILTMLILLDNQRGKNRKRFFLQNCFLILNGLTGILSCILVPAFIWKAVITKSRQVITQTALLCSCLLLQISVFYLFYLNNDASLKIRFGEFNPLYVLSKMIRFLISVPLYERYIFSSPTGEKLDALVRKAVSTITGPAIYLPKYNYYLVEMLLGLMIICYLLFLIYRKCRQLDTQLIVMAIILQTVISTYFSINSSSGPRYTFAPSIMIMLLLISASNDKTIARVHRLITLLLVILSVTVSLQHYRGNMMDGIAYDPSWPKWQDELKVWQADHNYPIRIWPAPWTMSLTGK